MTSKDPFLCRGWSLADGSRKVVEALLGQRIPGVLGLLFRRTGGLGVQTKGCVALQHGLQFLGTRNSHTLGFWEPRILMAQIDQAFRSPDQPVFATAYTDRDSQDCRFSGPITLQKEERAAS